MTESESDNEHPPSWWRSIDEHLAQRESDAPDPWADSDIRIDNETLTDDQAAFLTGLADQPAPPRIAEPDPLDQPAETGNSPGDDDVSPDVPSS